jgi:hypothetical protein
MELMKSVCDCRSKQNCSKRSKSVRKSSVGCGHTVCNGNFYNSPELAQFMKYKIKQTVLELHMLTGKMLIPVVKNKKLRKGEHCGQHSGDVAVLVWQHKK